VSQQSVMDDSLSKEKSLLDASFGFVGGSLFLRSLEIAMDVPLSDSELVTVQFGIKAICLGEEVFDLSKLQPRRFCQIESREFGPNCFPCLQIGASLS